MILDLPTTNNKYITSNITKVIKQKTNILPKKTLKNLSDQNFFDHPLHVQKKMLTMLTPFPSQRILLLRPTPSRSNSRPNSSQGRGLRNDRPTSAVSITSKSSKSSCLGMKGWQRHGSKVRGGSPRMGKKPGFYQK